MLLFLQWFYLLTETEQIQIDLNRLTGFPIGNIQRLRELAKVFVDVNTLQATTIRSQPLVQRNRVALWILPVGNARWYFPLLLLLDSHFAGGRVKHRCWWRWRTFWDLLVDFESGRTHRISLHLNHANDTLVCSGVVLLTLCSGSVADVLSRSLLFSSFDGHSCGYLGGNKRL